MFSQVHVSFKVFTHWLEDSRPEARRFVVEKSSITNFHDLNAKLHAVFPRLKTKTYSVTWKDEDGDDITISSDEEVMFFMAEFTNIIRLNVYVNEDEENNLCDNIEIPAVTDSPTVGPPNLKHEGVKCDGCNSAVVGFRYKCTSCNDFDLCSKCEANSIHPEHCMVRIPSPVMPLNMVKGAIKRSRNFSKTFADDKIQKRPGLSHDNLENFSILLNELGRLACKLDQQARIQELEKPGFTKKCMEAGQDAFIGGMTSTAKGRGLIGCLPPKVITQSPFSHPQLPTQPSISSKATEPALPPFWSVKAQVSNSSKSSIFNLPPNTQTQPLGGQPFNKWSGGVGNWAKPQIPFSPPNTSSSPLFGSTQTFGNSGVSTPLFGAAAPKSQSVQRESLDAQGTPHHPKPHIDEAIKKMLAMGFNNETGWLTQLLESNNGDIAAVLDLLPPVHPMKEHK